ncbi:MAG TPA: hypothetical protein VFD43_09605 [Planctomycetota bacterium]|nr:hypothetical protein [Planctomycetota bacterium]
MRLPRACPVAAAAALAVCAGPPAPPLADLPAAPSTWFEAQRGHPRAVLLLSPV